MKTGQQSLKRRRIISCCSQSQCCPSSSALSYSGTSNSHILYVSPSSTPLSPWASSPLDASTESGRWPRRPHTRVSVLGLAYYFGTYQKSDYRVDVPLFIGALRPAEDVLVIEAPRQHLLAKYYLGQDFPEPVPNIPCRTTGLSLPPVVPEEVDDQVLHYLDAYSSLWAAFSAESEVDGGEFLAKYITAVSYNLDCQFWLDVRLCRFISPHTVEPDIETQIAATFNDELILEHARIATDPQYVVSMRLLLVESLACRPTRPSTRVRCGWSTPRRIVAQVDQYPIGMLLPPMAAAGERKPGYMALYSPVPAGAIRCRQESTIPPRLSPSPTLRPTAGCLRRRPSSWDSSKSMVQYGCCPPAPAAYAEGQRSNCPCRPQDESLDALDPS